MKNEKREKAIELRVAGWAIPKIAEHLAVSKGSVSTWVRAVPKPEKFTADYRRMKKERRAKLRMEMRRAPKKRLVYGDRIAIRAPDLYKGKKYKGLYVYEHRFVLEQKIGRLLRYGEVAHHINGDPFDNRPENLELKTRKSHGKHHAKEKTMVKLTCDFCGVEFERELRNYNTKKRHGQTRFFCCKKHQRRAVVAEVE